MELTNDTEQTASWILQHVDPSSTKPDLTWYVCLSTIYQDYYEYMKAHRVDALAKYQFAIEVKKQLGPSIRVQERAFPVRRYDYRAKKWIDTRVMVWVIDGARYYKDKIGGQLVFGI